MRWDLRMWASSTVSLTGSKYYRGMGKLGTHQTTSYKGEGQGLRWVAHWAVLLVEVAGAEWPQPSHSAGLCSRGQAMFPLWIMPLSVMKKVEFTRDAAGDRLGKVSLFPLLINLLSTHWAWCQLLPQERGCVWPQAAAPTPGGLPQATPGLKLCMEVRAWHPASHLLP